MPANYEAEAIAYRSAIEPNPGLYTRRAALRIAAGLAAIPVGIALGKDTIYQIHHNSDPSKPYQVIPSDNDVIQARATVTEFGKQAAIARSTAAAKGETPTAPQSINPNDVIQAVAIKETYDGAYQAGNDVEDNGYRILFEGGTSLGSGLVFLGAVAATICNLNDRRIAKEKRAAREVAVHEDPKQRFIDKFTPPY